MIDVTHKSETLRSAIAEAVLRADARTIEAIQKKTVPKGDLIEAVRATSSGGHGE